MLQLKDIAARMDGCHPRTAKRWWKKINAELLAAGQPGVAPDVQGHGPHRWKAATFERLIRLWEGYYLKRGTSYQIVRAKHAGKKPKNFEMDLFARRALQKINPAKLSTRATFTKSKDLPASATQIVKNRNLKPDKKYAT